MSSAALCAWAVLSLPQSLADTLAVADTTSGVVRRYDATTGAYLGVFVSGGGLTLPYGLAFGSDGNLYVATYPGSVLRYNGSNGAFVDIFATASNHITGGLAFGPDRNLYVGLDTGFVQRFNGATGTSLGLFTPATIGSCGGLTFHNGSLLVTYEGSGTDGGRLRQYDGTTGAYITTLYAAFNGNGPRVPCFGPDGNLYVPDWQTFHVAKFDGTTFAFQGNLINDSAHPWPIALAFASDGTLLVLEDNGMASSVNRYNLATGAFIKQVIAPGSGGLGRGNALLLRSSPPRLSVQEAHRSEPLGTIMTLTWTNNGSACVLESSPALTGPWGQETTTWSTNGNWVSTQVISTNAKDFYRLRSTW